MIFNHVPLIQDTIFYMYLGLIPRNLYVTIIPVSCFLQTKATPNKTCECLNIEAIPVPIY